MEDLTIAQKDQALTEFDIWQKKRVSIGKVIVFTIALLNIIMSVIFFAVLDFKIIPLIIEIALSISLFFSVTWVRYFMASMAAIDSLRSILGFIAVVAYSPVWLIIFLVSYIAFNLTSCIMLFTNKCVSEYLYFRKHG